MWAVLPRPMKRWRVTKRDKPLRAAKAADNPASDGDEADDQIIGKAFRWSLLVIVIGGAAIGAAAVWFNRQPPPAVVKQSPATLPRTRETLALEIPQVKFTDVTQTAGIDFRHTSGAYGEKL